MPSPAPLAPRPSARRPSAPRSSARPVEAAPSASSRPPAPLSFDASDARVVLGAARQVLRRRLRVVRLVRDAYAHLAHDTGGTLDAVRDDLTTALRLVAAWATRAYRTVAWTPLVVLAGALVYFVMPADAVPDVLAGLGFVDDVAVISAAVRTVRDELDRFRAWEAARALPADASSA